MEISILQYPIGRFQKPTQLTGSEIDECISRISALPSKVIEAVENLNPEQLDTPYRPDGWTVRELIHHLPDSHMNAYIRFKLTLTEETPTKIRPYHEDLWAKLSDTILTPIDVSLNLLESLHQRWTVLMKAMSDEEMKRTYSHPENGTESQLEEVIAMYAWHGDHHLAHIVKLKERMAWK